MPLAGSWTKDARSRRHGPGSGAQGGPSGKVKGWRRWPDRGRGLLHGSGRGILTGASGTPGRKPGLQGLTGHEPRPVVRGVPGHRGAADDQGPVLLPDRGSRWPVAGSLALGLILGRCPGGGRGAPLAGSWTKDARSRRHGPGSGHRAGRPAR